MRVIAGLYKGRKLESSKDLSIRPTTDRVKEYIFNILQNFPQDKVILDVFSGSGSLGIEALSRGASFTIFVDKAVSSVNILRRNLNNLNISRDRYTIINSDAIDYINEARVKIDLCFMDPPYIYPQIQELINLFYSKKLLSEQGVLVVEHEISNPVEKENSLYRIFSQKKMSRSLIGFFEEKVV
jgi:16S rRNA (guanine966-N2)-methyltransferase